MADLFRNLDHSHDHDKTDGPGYAEITCPRCQMPLVPLEFSDYTTHMLGARGAQQREILYEGDCKCGAQLSVHAAWMIARP